MWGYEAGQSGVGDIFAWFADHLAPPESHAAASRAGLTVHELLSAEAAAQPAGASGLIALDWLNGNRSVLVNHHLSGAIVGLTLASRPSEIYRALLEATAFGTRVVIDAFEAAGLPVTELIIAGGLMRNQLLMQIYADVTRRPLSLVASEQAPALGSAIHAAVAAGAYPDVAAAAAAMGKQHAGASSRRTRRARTSTISCTPSTSCCTIISGAAPTTSCTGSGRCATGYERACLPGRAAGAASHEPGPGHEPPSGGTGRSRAWPGTVTGGSPAPPAGDAVSRTRHAVAELHAELVRNGLVAWTSGNVSARVPGLDLMVIKPSGVAYADLTAESMVVCDLSGTRVSGEHSPSSDTASHAYIYRHMPEVGGVVHTHSRYATAWAARGEPIPCVITAMADEFGGEIPVGPFAPIGGEEIGRAVVATLSGHRSPAVLLRSHGVFTVGATARDAVKAAVMCEDAACTVHLASVMGQVTPLPPDQIDALYRRYQDEYGQR